MKIVNVYLEHPVMQLNQTFSYFLSEQEHVERGCRVLVELVNKPVVGFVDSVVSIDMDQQQYEKQVGYKIKPVIKVIDQTPVLNDELYQLGIWMAENTISPYISCFQAMLPKAYKPVSNSGNVAKEWYVCLNDISLTKTEKQLKCAMLLKDKDMLRSQFIKQTGSLYQTLLKNNVISVYCKEKQASIDKLDIKEAPYPLTEKQQQAIDLINDTDKDVILLHGLTGSGKTEVYMQLAKQKILQGKQVLILVPEIALTPQMTQRLIDRFGSCIAIYHSGLNDSQRYQQYQLVKNNQVSLVVGTRSAIFMPFNDLGLIVLDEEHDHSYKQDSCPKYNCKDIAIQRGKYHHCKVVFGSATPTLESYSRAIKGLYQLVNLDSRIYNGLPNSTLVNMEQQIRKGNLILSDTLKQALIDTYKQQKQSILLLNRRGYNPTMKCVKCGETIKCPHCDMALSYHKDENVLKCHTCGYVSKLATNCPNCNGTQFNFYGVGTQRLTEEVEKLLPDARILRMDADTTSKKDSHKKILDAFGQGEADILIGTQMIAKGLDYPNVVLVGILNADALLSRVDYRCIETTFELIVQASGRSGRGTDKGRVIVQSYDTNHYGIKLAVKQDYIGFVNQEMKYRNINGLPPYSYMVEILMSSRNNENVYQEIDKANQYFRDKQYKVFGPANIMKKKDMYRYRLLIFSKDKQQLVNCVLSWYNELRMAKSNVSVICDVDPYSLD